MAIFYVFKESSLWVCVSYPPLLIRAPVILSWDSPNDSFNLIYLFKNSISKCSYVLKYQD